MQWFHSILDSADIEYHAIVLIVVHAIVLIVLRTIPLIVQVHSGPCHHCSYNSGIMLRI